MRWIIAILLVVFITGCGDDSSKSNQNIKPSKNVADKAKQIETGKLNMLKKKKASLIRDIEKTEAQLEDFRKKAKYGVSSTEGEEVKDYSQLIQIGVDRIKSLKLKVEQLEKEIEGLQRR